MSERKIFTLLRHPVTLRAARVGSSFGLVGLAMCSSFPAVAYVGPGAGLGVIGIVLAIGAALVMGIVGIVIWPIRALARRRKRGKTGERQPAVKIAGKADQVTPENDGARSPGTDRD